MPIALSTATGTVCVYDRGPDDATGGVAATLHRMLVLGPRTPVARMCLNPAGSLVAVAWESGEEVLVVNVASEAVVLRLLAHETEAVTAMCWDEAGTVLCSGDAAGRVVRADLSGSSAHVGVLANLGAPIVQVGVGAAVVVCCASPVRQAPLVPRLAAAR